jgi:formylglycine-generating enzyme required for sulfatase activity
MADVFVSYKKEDFKIAEQVVGGLQAEGISVWWDDGLTPKAAWDAELEREIAAAATVVVLWTPRSVNSDWVRTEAHYGQDRGKLVPVMLEECTIPIAFMLRQTLRLLRWDGDRSSREWRKLLTWIADLASTKPGNANIPQNLAPAQPNRFRDAVGRLASGDLIVDGALVNAATPATTAFRDGESLPVMRILPSGAFLLGSPADDPDRTAVEGPQKRIAIPVPFAIGVYPVLVAEYNAILGERPVATSAAPERRGLFGRLKRPEAPTPVPVPPAPGVPVTQISFDDAQALVAALSKTTGETYRIPSEAEWEYACRGGTRSRYSFGDAIDPSLALYAATSGPVAPGAYRPNAYGLYDMHGNVREWTADLWHESYDTTPLDGSAATAGHGSMRVARGGGWSDEAPLLRSTARMRATQFSRSPVIGLRVARALS